MTVLHSNTDKEEVAKFDDHAVSWWDDNGPMKPLHQLNPLRLHYVQKYCSLSGVRLLDVGCGGGIFSESLAQAGATVTAIDMNESALRVAREHAAQQGVMIDYQQKAVESLTDQQAGAFDVVTCMEMIEHVPDPVSVVQACAQLVKPDGYVFFSTINRTWRAWTKAIVGAEYVLSLLPRGTHQFDRFIRPSELERWGRQSQLAMTNLQGMSYQLLNQSFQYGRSVDTNYLMAFQKR